jgi:predicted dehydrogenase
MLMTNTPCDTPIMSSSQSKKKIRWGVLGVAGIAIKKVIPAMQQGELTEITAIASRDCTRAEQAAKELGIPKAYGSYEELLADPDIDAVYNPLPNHLHVPWSVKAAEAGKHVLCEKPISLTVAEARTLIAARDKAGVKIGEAFMVRTHPQWLRARELVRAGEIGELRAVMGAFSYFNNDPENIRNVPEYGGGGIMDIGCYPITMSRFLFDREPQRVIGLFDRDPKMQTDRLASAMLDFDSGQATFTCSTQLVAYQRMQILGTKARIEIEIPFNAPPDQPCRLFVHDGNDLAGNNPRVETFPILNQYTIQGDVFSQAILSDTEPPVPLENALGNMAVIEALFQSEHSGKWERPAAN